MINSKELAKYLCKRISEESILPDPSENELQFYIEQYKLRDVVGYSKWSNRFDCNIWIRDRDKDNNKERGGIE